MAQFRMEMPPDYIFKVILVGDSLVGKSSMFSRFMNKEFMFCQSTLGIDFGVLDYCVGGSRIKVQLWDTAGQERFHSLARHYYRGSSAVMIVYDITNEFSYENAIGRWLDVLKQEGTLQDANPRYLPVVMLIGNKCDLDTARRVTYADAKAFCDKEGYCFTETSAMNNTHLEAAIYELLQQTVKVKRSFLEQKSTLKLCGHGLQPPPHISIDVTPHQRDCVQDNKEMATLGATGRKRVCCS